MCVPDESLHACFHLGVRIPDEGRDVFLLLFSRRLVGRTLDALSFPRRALLLLVWLGGDTAPGHVMYTALRTTEAVTRLWGKGTKNKAGRSKRMPLSQ